MAPELSGETFLLYLYLHFLHFLPRLKAEPALGQSVQS